MSNLPDSKIVVKDGKVQSVEGWTLWNGTPWNTVLIKRTTEGFSATISDPEHGGSNQKGKNLVDLLGRFHANVQKKYVALFAMKDVTVERLQDNFPAHVVVIL